MAIELKDLWTPVGLLLGFQMTILMWRIQQEEAVRAKGDIPWLIPSDYLSILGMLVFVVGTMLLPLAGVVCQKTAETFFGLGALLFVGQLLGVAGHYQLFNLSSPSVPQWLPLQEKVVLFIVLVAGAVYLWLAFAG